MDRSVLEGNPHQIIEGMAIGAYGTGATEGIIYVRNEYPLAIKHLLIALRQARQIGLLGKNILGAGFSFDIRLVKGAGASGTGRSIVGSAAIRISGASTVIAEILVRFAGDTFRHSRESGNPSRIHGFLLLPESLLDRETIMFRCDRQVMGFRGSYGSVA